MKPDSFKVRVSPMLENKKVYFATKQASLSTILEHLALQGSFTIDYKEDGIMLRPRDTDIIK